MQHSSAVMGLVPMTPEMWLELEPIKHRCHLQLAAVRQFPREMHGVALLLQWPSRFTLGNWVSLSFCGLGATVRWNGASIVARFRRFRRALLCAASAAKGHWNHLGATACAQGARDFLYCFKACVDSSPKPQRGNIPLLARAPAPCSTPLL